MGAEFCSQWRGNAAAPTAVQQAGRDRGRLPPPHARSPSITRMSIGTITSDGMIKVSYLKGGTLGTNRRILYRTAASGQPFCLAGPRAGVGARQRDDGLCAQVEPEQRQRPAVDGVADAAFVAACRRPCTCNWPRRTARYDSAELMAVRPILELQQRWSRIPAPGELLIESAKSTTATTPSSIRWPAGWCMKG